MFKQKKYDENELKHLQKVQLMMLKDFIKICDDNNILYFVIGGTLLGTIRHEGFIPWDDDIDIWMPRDDYERFCVEFPQEQDAHGLKIVNSHTDVYYGRPMSKVIDTRTVLVEPNYLCDDAIGVNIDIWPLDGTPSDVSERAVYSQKMKRYLKMLYGRIVRLKACKGFAQKVGHIMLMPISPKKLVEKICALQKQYKYSDSDVVACYVDPYKKEYKREWFNNQVFARFEGCEFCIPSGADEILTVIYGNYMKLPPLSQQQPHHITNAFWK